MSGVVTRTTGLRGYLCEGHLAIKSSTGAAPLPRHVTWGLASRVHVTFWRRQLAAAPLLRRRFGRERGVVRRFSEGTFTSGAAGNWPNGLHFGEACLGRGQRAFCGQARSQETATRYR